MNYELSVIIPIYNVEKYLSKCVDSVLAQSEQNIEIVLVDDGSPDTSGEIADNYAKSFERVKVIHQKNSGLGPARNSGMQVATGKYLAFLDSDDWVDEKMYEKLLDVARKTNADIIVGGHTIVTHGVTVVSKIHPLAGKTLDNKNDILLVRKELFGHAVGHSVVEAFPMSACMSLYKRQFIVENNLEFEEILSEDTIFNLYAYKAANVISFTGYTDYYYRKEEQASITKSFSEKKACRYIEFINRLVNISADENDLDCAMRVKRTVINYIRLYVGLVADSDLSIKEMKKFIKLFVESEIVNESWKGFPVDSLPIQQRIYHVCLMHHFYSVCIWLNIVRKKMKRFWH